MERDELEALTQLRGTEIRSVTGVPYRVVEVNVNSSVVLEGANRQKPSRLPWRDIEIVVRTAAGGQRITPTAVDQVLGKPNNRDSSTMAALVIAIRSRLRRAR